MAGRCRRSLVPLLLLCALVAASSAGDGPGEGRELRKRVLKARQHVSHPVHFEWGPLLQDEHPLVRAQTALSSAFAKRLDAPRFVSPLLEDDDILPFYSAVQVLRYVASPDCLEGLARAKTRLSCFDARDRYRLHPLREVHWGCGRITGRRIDGPEDVEDWMRRFHGLPVPWRFGVDDFRDTWAALVLLDLTRGEATTGQPFPCMLYLATGPPLLISPEVEWRGRGVAQVEDPSVPTIEELTRWRPRLNWRRLSNAFLPEEPVGPIFTSDLKPLRATAHRREGREPDYAMIAFEAARAPELPGWYRLDLEGGSHLFDKPLLPKDALPVFVYVQAGEELEKEIDDRLAHLGAIEELSGTSIREDLKRLLEIRSGRVVEPLLKVLEYANERDERGKPTNVSAGNLDLLCGVLGMTGDPRVVEPLLGVLPFTDRSHEWCAVGCHPAQAVGLVGWAGASEFIRLLDQGDLTPENRELLLRSLLQVDLAAGIGRLMAELEAADSPDLAQNLVQVLRFRGARLAPWKSELAALCREYRRRGGEWRSPARTLVDVLSDADPSTAIELLEGVAGPLDLFELADLYLRTQQYEKLLALKEPGSATKEDRVLFTCFRAEAAYQLGRYDLAAGLLREVLGVPEVPDRYLMAASYRLSQCLEESGRLPEALAVLEPLAARADPGRRYRVARFGLDGRMVHRRLTELRDRTQGDVRLAWRARSISLLKVVRDGNCLGLATGSVAGGGRGDVVEVDLQTGAVRVVFKPLVREKPLAVAVEGDMMAYASDVGFLFGVATEDWALRWRVPARISAPAGIVGGAGLFFARDGEGQLIAFDAGTGAVRWQLGTDDVGRHYPRPFVLDGRLLYRSRWNVLGSIDVASGRLSAPDVDFTVGRLTGAYPTRFESPSEPILLEDKIVLADRRAGLVALSRQGGDELWRSPLKGWVWNGRLNVSPEGLWVPQPGKILLFDPATGELLRTVTFDWKDYPTVAVGPDRLVCLLRDREVDESHLVICDPRTGRVVARRDLGEDRCYPPLLVWGDTIILRVGDDIIGYRFPAAGWP